MEGLRPFIHRILKKRQSQRPMLENVQKGLGDLEVNLDRVGELAAEAFDSSDAPEQLRQLAGSLKNHLIQMRNKIADIKAFGANLVARYSKNTINIGVAGKTGMGKSTFLQAISGLDNQVIPTSSGEPCTGAKSIVVHDEGEPHARIEYFNENDFLRGIVNSYYSDVGLGDAPITLPDFSKGIPPKPEKLTPHLHAVYDKLQKLHGLLPRYWELLSRPSERVSLSEIKPFVSQEDGRYLAVRCATIHTRFPQGDVSGLGLIDLPGLGEVAKGHGERLIQSLEQDVDAVVVIKRPLPGRAVYDTEDHKVFDLVKSSVPDLDLSDWLFLVLNRDANNTDQVEILKKNPPNIGAQPRIFDANCSDRSEVAERVFLRILEHLESNLEKIDQRQIKALKESLFELGNEVEGLLEPLAIFFQVDKAGTADYQKFDDMLRDFCRQLRVNLDQLTSRYRELVGQRAKAEEFVSAVDSACDAAKSEAKIPSPTELENQYYNLGGWPAVVQEELHYLRSYLAHALSERIDLSLAALVEGVRREVLSHVLADPIGRLVSKERLTVSDPQTQLDEIRKILQPSEQPSLMAGFDFLGKFSFSYQSHFHHRVRESMDPLDPLARREEGEDDPIEAITPRAPSNGKQSEEVARGLKAYFDKVVFAVRKRLHDEMGNDPMRAIFSTVEEIRDRLARTKNVERQWASLLYPRRADIWPEEFNRFAVASARREEWVSTISLINRLASSLQGRLS